MWKKYSPNRLYSNFVKENQKQQLKKHERYPPCLIMENFHRTTLSCRKCDKPFSCCTTYFLYNYQPPPLNFEFMVRTLKLAQNQNIPWKLVFIFGGFASNVFSSFKRVANSIMETLTSLDGFDSYMETLTNCNNGEF